MKNIREYKEKLENNINLKLKEFQDKTGLDVSYVDFTKEKSTGFGDVHPKYSTNIIIKND